MNDLQVCLAIEWIRRIEIKFAKMLKSLLIIIRPLHKLSFISLFGLHISLSTSQLKRMNSSIICRLTAVYNTSQTVNIIDNRYSPREIFRYVGLEFLIERASSLITLFIWMCYRTEKHTICLFSEILNSKRWICIIKCKYTISGLTANNILSLQRVIKLHLWFHLFIARSKKKKSS